MMLVQLLVIILLLSFILFIMFQVEEVEGFNVKNIEGMADLAESGMTDPDLPPCPANSAGVPSCGSAATDPYLNDFYKDENYVLKTRIVTPVCPKDPYDSVCSDWKKEHEDLHKKERDKDKEEREKDERERRRLELSNNSLPNLNRDISSNPLPEGPLGLLGPTPPNPNFFNSNTMLNNNTLLSTPEKKVEPEPAKAEDKKSTPEDLSKCPPCPACERCPEPTVDCKKVVNYKNKSYPVPLIADFSNFSKFG